MGKPYRKFLWGGRKGYYETTSMKKALKREMADSPIQRLESAIAKRRRIRAEICELRRRLTETSARREALAISGELDDPAVLTELGQLLVLVEVLPRRIAFREENEAKEEEALAQATNAFIGKELGPRVRRLRERTRTVVQAELSAHIHDPAMLMRAVAESERVRRLSQLERSVTLQPAHGAIAHAEGVVKAWADADEVEKALPAENGGAYLQAIS